MCHYDTNDVIQPVQHIGISEAVRNAENQNREKISENHSGKSKSGDIKKRRSVKAEQKMSCAEQDHAPDKGERDPEFFLFVCREPPISLWCNQGGMHFIR